MASYKMWNAEEAARIIAEYSHLDGALLPMLHALHETFGYLPEAVTPMIGEALNQTRAEIHGVISFYSDFRREPPTKHNLKLCRAEACQAAGGDALAAQAESRLGIAMGEETADRLVALEPVYCLGLCACAPSAMIDGRVVGRLDTDTMDSLLAEAQE